MPESDPRRAYSEWLFSNAEELEAVMHRIRDEVVDVFARPLWERPGALKELVERSEEQERQRSQAEAVARTKEVARAAFEATDHARAVALYRRLTRSELEPSDRKRLEIAERKMDGRA